MTISKPLVSSVDEVRDNIFKFNNELEGNPGLQDVLGYNVAWYALKDDKGRWHFGPSKFVGYANNSAKYYIGNYDKGLTGTDTESVLGQWFFRCAPESDLGRELGEGLRVLLARYGKRLNKRWRVSTIDGEVTKSRQSPFETGNLLERIVSNPGICGGRPCIRGTRMRVSDIVDMLGHGATQAEILADFPYIKADDIRAALIYAARAMDHPVVRAA